MSTAVNSKTEGWLFLAGFVACIPAANWMVGHVGTTCVPDWPCIIPVAPGLSAPSAVLIVGLALVLRDLVQRRLGKSWALIAIGLGTLLSAILSPPALVVASAAAFLLSELTDFAILHAPSAAASGARCPAQQPCCHRSG